MLDINLRVFLKQNPSLVGTTKEFIYNHNGKTMFKVEWDRSTFLSQQTVFDVRYISELYTHKSLRLKQEGTIINLYVFKKSPGPNVTQRREVLWSHNTQD
jgi:hypothetical protein